jgi:hypothetical protein
MRALHSFRGFQVRYPIWFLAVLVLVAPCLAQSHRPTATHATSPHSTAGKSQKLPTSTAKPGAPAATSAVVVEQKDLAHAEKLNNSGGAGKTRVAAAQPLREPHSSSQTIRYGYQRPKEDTSVHLGQMKNPPHSEVKPQGHPH